MSETQLDAVEALQQAIGRGGGQLFDVVPTILKAVIEDRSWAERTDKRGMPFTSFEAFVTHRLWWGLESSIDDLLHFCRNHEDVQRLIRGEVALAGKVGRPKKDSWNVDNVNIKSGSGNEQTYALRRLKRDNPALAEQVVAGALSAHAAAVQAGFRKPTWTAPADPERLAAALARRFPEYVFVRRDAQ